MRRKNYIRTILHLGGSMVIAIPPAFMRRKKIVSGVKLLVQDEGDYIVLKTINEDTLNEIRQDERAMYLNEELKRVKVLSWKYREKEINKQTKGVVTWKKKKTK